MPRKPFPLSPDESGGQDGPDSGLLTSVALPAAYWPQSKPLVFPLHDDEINPGPKSQTTPHELTAS